MSSGGSDLTTSSAAEAAAAPPSRCVAEGEELRDGACDVPACCCVKSCMNESALALRPRTRDANTTQKPVGTDARAPRTAARAPRIAACAQRIAACAPRIAIRAPAEAHNSLASLSVMGATPSLPRTRANACTACESRSHTPKETQQGGARRAKPADTHGAGRNEEQNGSLGEDAAGCCDGAVASPTAARRVSLSTTGRRRASCHGACSRRVESAAPARLVA
eukprot:5584786-Prymnesium_polylepis.2